MSFHQPTIVCVRRCTFGLQRLVWIGRCRCGFRVERGHELAAHRALAEHRAAVKAA